ncbi:MAG TPA: sigma 54-interacting transcriptional regulator [Acidisarcina sp.]
MPGQIFSRLSGSSAGLSPEAALLSGESSPGTPARNGSTPQHAGTENVKSEPANGHAGGIDSDQKESYEGGANTAMGPQQTRPPSPAGSNLEREPQTIRQHPEAAVPGASFHGMGGRSPAMRRFFSQIQITAPYLRIATLEGEDGTGKTLAARTLHGIGPFEKGPFVPCLSTVFLDPQFSGLALPWSPAIIAQARGGMLFLDRVDLLDALQQARLFQFLLWFDDQQERSSNSSDTPRQTVVSSTTSLRRMGAADALHGDLCSRLTAIRFVLPPLRERREDIPLLAHLFAVRFSQTYRKPIRGLAPEALPLLVRHAWPGNVRELESVITSAALQTESQWIRSIDLPILPSPASAEAKQPENEFNLDRVILRHVERTLERTRGNKVRAASMLGISRSTLYRILGSN